MKISFIICLHTSRINNLKQTLRFLEKREPNLHGSEIFINFHDIYENEIKSDCFLIKKVNHNLEIYNKPLMCNHGVFNAENDIICILDSDRILPENYFFNASKNLNYNDFVTTEYIKQCIKEEDDLALENNSFEYIQEERSIKNSINCKNLFSGNVLFYKKKYMEIGGMDETFIGYSFNDNDITQKVISDPLNNALYNNVDEIHLYHDKNFFFSTYNFTKEEKEVHCVTNMLKFCNKWKIEVNERYKEAKHYVGMANKLKNEKIKERFFDEFKKCNLFI